MDSVGDIGDNSTLLVFPSRLVRTGSEEISPVGTQRTLTGTREGDLEFLSLLSRTSCPDEQHSPPPISYTAGTVGRENLYSWVTEITRKIYGQKVKEKKIVAGVGLFLPMIPVLSYTTRPNTSTGLDVEGEQSF